MKDKYSKIKFLLLLVFGVLVGSMAFGGAELKSLAAENSKIAICADVDDAEEVSDIAADNSSETDDQTFMMVIILGGGLIIIIAVVISVVSSVVSSVASAVDDGDED